MRECVRVQEEMCVGKEVAVVVEERIWEEVEARTAFPQSRPQLPPAAAVGGFCGGAPCPAGINSVHPRPNRASVSYPEKS